MAWIESHQTVWDHPKTRRAARHLGIEQVQMVGHLQSLWHWALDHAEDGDLSRYDAEDVAIAARWAGDADKFVDALVSCGPGGGSGFVDMAERGLRLHNWGLYTERLVSRREASRKANHDRWHVARGVRQDGCEWCADSDTDADAIPPDSERIPNGQHPESTQPDPTKPDQTELKTKSVPRKRATRLPDDWRPAPEPELVKALGGQDAAKREWEKFRDHFKSKSGRDATKVDWQATWRNWLRRADEFQPSSNGARASPSKQVDEFQTTRRLK